MKSRSYIPLLATLLLVFAVFTGGCAGSDESSNNANSSANSSTETSSTESAEISAADTHTLGILGSKDAVVDALVAINHALHPEADGDVLDARFDSQPNTGKTDYYLMSLTYLNGDAPDDSGSGDSGLKAGEGEAVWSVYTNGEETATIDGTFTIQDDGIIQIGEGTSVESGKTGLYPNRDGKDLTSFSLSYEGLDEDGRPTYDLIATGGELTLTTVYGSTAY